MTRAGRHRTANSVFGRSIGKPAAGAGSKSVDPVASADCNSVATDRMSAVGNNFVAAGNKIADPVAPVGNKLVAADNKPAAGSPRNSKSLQTNLTLFGIVAATVVSTPRGFPSLRPNFVLFEFAIATAASAQNRPGFVSPSNPNFRPDLVSH